MKRYKKIFYLAGGILTGLIIILAFACALKYLHTTPTGKLPEIRFKIANSGDIKLCDPITLQTDIECDWKTSPKKIEIELPDGLQIISKEKFEIKKISWGKLTWRIELAIQAYKPGEYSTIKGRAFFGVRNSKDIETGLSSDAFTVSEISKIDEKSKPEMVGKIVKKSKLYLYLIIAACLIIVAAIIAFAIFAKKRNQLKEQIRLPAWRIALDKLEELRLSQEKRLMTPTICVVKLCDIIRDYLQERFSINAPKMTSYEFLSSLKKSSSPLNDEHKKFLNQFMESSDMIKFADMPADTEMIDTAIAKAEELVRETIPSEKQGEKK